MCAAILLAGARADDWADAHKLSEAETYAIEAAARNGALDAAESAEAAARDAFERAAAASRAAITADARAKGALVRVQQEELALGMAVAADDKLLEGMCRPGQPGCTAVADDYAVVHNTIRRLHGTAALTQDDKLHAAAQVPSPRGDLCGCVPLLRTHAHTHAPTRDRARCPRTNASAHARTHLLTSACKCVGVLAHATNARPCARATRRRCS